MIKTLWRVEVFIFSTVWNLTLYFTLGSLKIMSFKDWVKCSSEMTLSISVHLTITPCNQLKQYSNMVMVTFTREVSHRTRRMEMVNIHITIQILIRVNLKLIRKMA